MTIESVSTHRSPTAEHLVADLEGSHVSGVLEFTHPGDSCSRVWVREGQIYAMQVPGYRPELGIRLLSGGLISPEQLSSAAMAQRDRFPVDQIGTTLVEMGLVDQDVIDDFVRDQVVDQLVDLMDLVVLDTTFHAGRRVQVNVIAPTAVSELMAAARERRANRLDVLNVLGGTEVVPVLGPPGQSAAETPLGPYDWALLCRVDGRRDITELARVCGYTVHEAALMVADLTATGLLLLPEPEQGPAERLAPVVSLRPGGEESPAAPEWHFDGTDAGEPEPVADLLAEFSAFVNDDFVNPVLPVVPVAPPAEPVTDPGPTTCASVTPSTQESGATPVAAEAESPVGRAADAPVENPPADPPAAPAAVLIADQTPATEPTWPMSSVASAEVEAPAQRSAATATAVFEAPAPEQVMDESAGMFPSGAPVAPSDGVGYSDTSVFMRELSSLSDDPADTNPEVTRVVVPFTETRRKRRFWAR